MHRILFLLSGTSSSDLKVLWGNIDGEILCV